MHRFLCFILLLTGCTPCLYQYNKEGAEEFVLDSYKIQQESFLTATPCATNVMVVGKKGDVHTFPLSQGYISIQEALALAGELSCSGDKRAILVIRGNIANPKVYQLSWNHIILLPNSSLLLIPGDTLYLSKKPIRVI